MWEAGAEVDVALPPQRAAAGGGLSCTLPWSSKPCQKLATRRAR